MPGGTRDGSSKVSTAAFQKLALHALSGQEGTKRGSKGGSPGKTQVGSRGTVTAGQGGHF